MARNVARTGSPRPDSVRAADPAGAPSALSPDAAWMLPPTDLVSDVESAFATVGRRHVPAYGGLRYTAAWWESRAGH